MDFNLGLYNKIIVDLMIFGVKQNTFKEFAHASSVLMEIYCQYEPALCRLN